MLGEVRTDGKRTKKFIGEWFESSSSEPAANGMIIIPAAAIPESSRRRLWPVLR
jgi:hypothetical protein